MNRLLARVLWSNQSWWQWLVTGIGFVAGLVLILVALQLHSSINKLLFAKQNAGSGQYLIISKAGSFAKSGGRFTDQEIKLIKEQPFTESVGAFSTNHFRASVKIDKIIRFQTLIFLESVPTPFIDNPPDDWYWHQGQSFVPIIIPRDFVNLYNYGFAPSRGMPQVSPDIIMLLPLTLDVQGDKGKSRRYEAQIVGLSDRISSVLVPESFLAYNNQDLAGKKKSHASRLIVKTEQGRTAEAEQFFDRQQYETNSDKLRTGRIASVAITILSILGGLGLAFMVLSVAMSLLSFRLALTEAKEEITLLVELGYRDRVILMQLMSMFGFYLATLLVVALIIVYFMVMGLQEFLSGRGFTLSANVLTTGIWLAGVAITIFIFFINYIIALRLLRKTSRY